MAVAPASVVNQVALAHAQQKVVVLATGVFDLLHQEHKNFLAKAKAAGDFLVVGIESDLRTKAMKGPDRPKDPQELRLQKIQALPYVDLAFILPDNFGTPQQNESLIAELRPTYLASSSHSPYLEKKQAIMAKYGGQVKIVHQHNPNISTTLKIAAMQESQSAQT
jgi:cytidyltransferase-like protein